MLPLKQGTLDTFPDYANAYFNLFSGSIEMNKKIEKFNHWMRYQGRETFSNIVNIFVILSLTTVSFLLIIILGKLVRMFIIGGC